MKKTIIFLMMIVSVFAFGLVFSADSIAGVPYNGVTAFDLGLAAGSGNAAATEIAALDNGITSFGEIQKTGSEAKGYSAGGIQPGDLAKKPYNGITVF